MAAALFVLLLSITGVALNHSAELGLDRRFLNQVWLLERYGIDGPEIAASFATDLGRITLADSRLYLDARNVAGVELDSVAGAVSAGTEVIVATPDELIFLDRGGDIVDRSPVGLYLPGSITAVAAPPAAAVAAATVEDTDIWLMSSDVVWSYDTISGAVAPADVPLTLPRWAQASDIADDLRRDLERAHRGAGLSVERVLSDLHSGRLFGISGAVVMDLAALAFCVLAVTGVMLWLRR